MGKNNPMRVKYYTYRVEFQARGAGHIHGVLWLDMDRLEEDHPGLSNAMGSLQSSTPLTQAQKGSLKTFVDRFVTCSLQNSVTKIVSEVQIHHHSKSCRKYGTNCRFSYPRFPSKQTIIAEPLQQNDFSSEAEYIGAKKRAKEISGSVQD